MHGLNRGRARSLDLEIARSIGFQSQRPNSESTKASRCLLKASQSLLSSSRGNRSFNGRHSIFLPVLLLADKTHRRRDAIHRFLFSLVHELSTRHTEVFHRPLLNPTASTNRPFLKVAVTDAPPGELE